MRCADLQMLAVFGQMQSVHWPQSFIDFIRRLDITEIIGINAWISKVCLRVLKHTRTHKNWP